MKTKSLFDHITHITQRQTKNYFEDINDAEAFIDSNWFGKEKKFYTIEEKI